MKRFSEDKYFMPTQLDVGTPQKDVTDAIETPMPLAKGYDGMPKFNELNEAQKKNMPKAIRSQVAFQQKKLQYSNYQIINANIKPTDSGTSASNFEATFNSGVTVGTALTDGILFGSNVKNSDRAKYYNIVYANVRFSETSATAVNLLQSPSYIEFYPMQKVPGGVFGGKIPRQIEATVDQTNIVGFYADGTDNGVQSFGVDIYNENAYYTQSPDLKGVRCCGIALKEIFMNFGENVTYSNIYLHLEIGIDLITEGNNY